MQNNSYNTKFPELDIDKDYFLREQRYADAKDFFKYFADPQVSQYILSSIPTNFEEAQEEIMYWIDLYYKNTGIYWAIATKNTDKMIGAIGFHDWNKYNNRTEISYDLSKDHWGKGIMSKATKVVLQFAFETLNINRVQASTIKENINSIKLLESNNFSKDGILRKYRYHRGKYYDIEMFSILKEDFKQHNNQKKNAWNIWNKK